MPIMKRSVRRLLPLIVVLLIALGLAYRFFFKIFIKPFENVSTNTHLVHTVSNNYMNTENSTLPEKYVDGKLIGKEWVQVSRSATLPAGLDVEIDLSTGIRRVRLAQQGSTSDAKYAVIAVADDKNERNSSTTAPPSSRKWERVYAGTSAKGIMDEKIEGLLSPNLTADQQMSILDFLEEEAHAYHIGAGIAHSTKIDHVLLLLFRNDQPQVQVKVLEILFACVQNNKDAVQALLPHEITIVGNGDVKVKVSLLKRLVDMMIEQEHQEGTPMRRILSILGAMVRLAGARASGTLVRYGCLEIVPTLVKSHCMASVEVGSTNSPSCDLGICERSIALLALLVQHSLADDLSRSVVALERTVDSCSLKGDDEQMMAVLNEVCDQIGGTEMLAKQTKNLKKYCSANAKKE